MMNRSGYAKDLPVVVERSGALSLPPDFMRLSGTARLNAILNMAEPARFLRKLREDEFVYLLNGIGLEDAGCLMQYSTDRQRRVLVDMDAWSGGEFLPDRFDRLVGAAKESGLDFTLKLIRDLDPEVVILSLFKRASFHTLEEAEDIEFADGTTFLTPDNVFLVACLDPDDVPAVRAELDLLYAVGVEFAHRLIQSGRWDTIPSLEHQSSRYRTSRLSEAGFPDEDNEFELYEPFDLEGFRKRVLSDASSSPPPGVTVGEPLALAVVGTSDYLFFWRVLDAAGPGRLNSAFILSQTMNLVNRVLGSSVTDLSDPGAWESVSEYTLTVLSTGLEAVCGNDPATGVDVLGRAAPMEFFRAGIEFIRPVNMIARQVVADLGGLANLCLFGVSASADIDAAAAFPTLCPPTIAGGPARNFHGCTEVLAATRLMKKYRAVVQFASGVLGFVPSRQSALTDSIVQPTFENVVATAWARQVMGGGLSIVPLSLAEVGLLRRTAFENGRIKASLRVGKGEDDEYSTAVREFLNVALDHVEECLGSLSGDFDIRMVGDSILVR